MDGFVVGVGTIVFVFIFRLMLFRLWSYWVGEGVALGILLAESGLPVVEARGRVRKMNDT